MLYQLHRLITWSLVIASPVRLAAALPVALPIVTHASTANVAPYQLTLDTHTLNAVTVHTAPRPNFDTEVLAPLHAAQAEAAAKAAAQPSARAASRKIVPVDHPVVILGDDAFAAVRFCESGGDYARNSGNGYYGAYQYAIGSWANYGGFSRPDLAPPNVQDAKAHADVAARGWSAWPTCARKAGLL